MSEHVDPDRLWMDVQSDLKGDGRVKWSQVQLNGEDVSAWEWVSERN